MIVTQDLKNSALQQACSGFRGLKTKAEHSISTRQKDENVLGDTTTLVRMVGLRDGRAVPATLTREA